MEYIQKIRKLIGQNKVSESEHRGTAFTSKPKSMIKTQINFLDEKLNHSYYSVQSEDEKEQTEFALKLLKVPLEDQYNNMPEHLNIGKLLFGLDVELLDANHNQITALEQTFKVYNGKKTSDIELVRNVMIFFNALFEKCTLSSQEKAEYILEITKILFLDVFKQANSEKRDNLVFTKIHIDKDWGVKTVLQNTLIFNYQTETSQDILFELVQTGFNDLQGLQSIYEPDFPTEEEVSDFYRLRNLLKNSKIFNYSKDELKALLFFGKHFQL